MLFLGKYLRKPTSTSRWQSNHNFPGDHLKLHICKLQQEYASLCIHFSILTFPLWVCNVLNPSLLLWAFVGHSWNFFLCTFVFFICTFYFYFRWLSTCIHSCFCNIDFSIKSMKLWWKRLFLIKFIKKNFSLHLKRKKEQIFNIWHTFCWKFSGFYFLNEFCVLHVLVYLYVIHLNYARFMNNLFIGKNLFVVSKGRRKVCFYIRTMY